MAFTACETTMSDCIYSLTPLDSSTGSYVSYNASGAEDILGKCLAETATPAGVGYMSFVKKGEVKESDKAMKTAFEKGIKQIEGADDYNSFFFV